MNSSFRATEIKGMILTVAVFIVTMFIGTVAISTILETAALCYAPLEEALKFDVEGVMQSETICGAVLSFLAYLVLSNAYARARLEARLNRLEDIIQNNSK